MEEKVETTKKPTVKALSAENEQLKQEIEALKSEVSKTKDNAYKEGKFDIVKKILVVGDTLDRALSMDLDDKTKDGLKMIARSFAETLESEGITEINPVGERFDPNTQEAVMQVPKEDGEEEGTVKQVFLKGYKQGDKVIRYAQVVVIG